MVDTKEIKESLQREIDALTRARDEMKLQLKLAQGEAREEWSRIEGTVERLQTELRRIHNDAKEPLKDMGQAALNLVDELKRGFSRLRQGIKEPPQE